jgi:hypothetical protein
VIPITAVSLLIFLLLIGMSFLFVASDNILDEGDENWYDNQTNREESQG